MVAKEGRDSQDRWQVHRSLNTWALLEVLGIPPRFMQGAFHHSGLRDSVTAETHEGKDQGICFSGREAQVLGRLLGAVQL